MWHCPWPSVLRCCTVVGTVHSSHSYQSLYNIYNIIRMLWYGERQQAAPLFFFFFFLSRIIFYVLSLFWISNCCAVGVYSDLPGRPSPSLLSTVRGLSIWTAADCELKLWLVIAPYNDILESQRNKKLHPTVVFVFFFCNRNQAEWLHSLNKSYRLTVV